MNLENKQELLLAYLITDKSLENLQVIERRFEIMIHENLISNLMCKINKLFCYKHLIIEKRCKLSV